MSNSLNSTRNLFADNLQIILTDIISIFSTLTTFIGIYTIICSDSRETRSHKYIQMLYHIVLYLSQLFAGTVLNLVVLFPTPGAYCIGWLRDASGWWNIGSLTLFFFLFSFQGQLLALLLFIEIQIVARPDSIFKFPKCLTVISISSFILINTVPLVLSILSSDIPRSETTDYVIRALPYHQFLLRYPFLWILTSKKVYICLLASVFCSVGLIILSIMIAYILVLYELERQVNIMSKKAASAHKQLIDEVMLHGKIIFPFFLLIAIPAYVQFFVKEETDVSVPLAISFSIFTAAPIPAMILFLYSNPTYRKFFKEIMLITRRRETVRVASGMF